MLCVCLFFFDDEYCLWYLLWNTVWIDYLFFKRGRASGTEAAGSALPWQPESLRLPVNGRAFVFWGYFCLFLYFGQGMSVLVYCLCPNTTLPIFEILFSWVLLECGWALVRLQGCFSSVHAYLHCVVKFSVKVLKLKSRSTCGLGAPATLKAWQALRRVGDRCCSVLLFQSHTSVCCTAVRPQGGEPVVLCKARR